MIRSVIALSLMAVQLSFAQPFSFSCNSLTSVTLSTFYSDLLRTKNSFSNTTISLKKTSALFESTIGRQKYFISLETERNLVRIDNSISQIDFRTGQSINRLSTGSELMFEPFFTEIFFRVNQIKSVSTIDYGGSIGFRNSSHWFEQFRAGYYSYSVPWIFGLKYQDAEIDVNNLTALSKIYYKADFKSLWKTRIGLQFEKYLSSKNKNVNPAFAVEDQTSGSYTNISVGNNFFSIPFKIDFSHGQGESFFDLLYSQNSFSQNSFTDALYNGVNIKSSESLDYNWLPALSIGYHFVKGSMVGNIQSWPFGSFLTSLIINRINYRLAGQVFLFSFDAEKKFTFSDFSIQPEFSFYQILPEITLDNWQPSYLVFGVKDFARNILPIRKALVGKMSLSVSYNLEYCTLSFQATQFIPIQIIKKDLPTTVVSPIVSGESSKPSEIDGGRWFSFSIRRSL